MLLVCLLEVYLFNVQWDSYLRYMFLYILLEILQIDELPYPSCHIANGTVQKNYIVQ